MKKLGIAAVLTEILDTIEQHRKPSPELIKQGRAALSSAKRNLKAATKAAAASGRSGRKVSYDQALLERLITEGKLSNSQIATQVGCSDANVVYKKNKMRKEAEQNESKS